MTATTYSSAATQNSDAEFRAWGLELSNALTACGLPKSGDTGQIDWATVSRPAANTSAGYEIRYFNDSLHATKPFYIRIEFRSADVNTRPQMRISAASATNGAGTLSGTTYFSATDTCATNMTPAAGNYPTFVCVKDGYVAVAFKRRASTGLGEGVGFFSLMRTTDSAGSISSAGFLFYFITTTSTSGLLRRQTYLASLISDTTAFCMFPGANTTTLVGADVQVMKHFFYAPTITVCPFVVSYIHAEIGNESTFTATPVGATSRTFVALGATGVPTNCSINAASNHCLAMQYD